MCGKGCAKGSCTSKDAAYMGPVNKGYGATDKDAEYKIAEKNSYENQQDSYLDIVPAGIEKYINFQGSYSQNGQQDNMAYMLAAMFLAQYMDDNKDSGKYSKIVGEMLLGSMLKKAMGGLEKKMVKN